MESCKKQKSSTHLIFFISENITFSYISLAKISLLEICVFISSIFLKLYIIKNIMIETPFLCIIQCVNNRQIITGAIPN